jgi:type IV secretory pathway VirJ component
VPSDPVRSSPVRSRPALGDQVRTATVVAGLVLSGLGWPVDHAPRAIPGETSPDRVALPAELLVVGKFGSVTIYHPSGPPSSVVLFISGDGGWNLGVVDMARDLAASGALVVGIDIRNYRSAVQQSDEACVYSAADFEALAQYVERRFELSRYLPPILVGHSSGATLAYVVLAQGPPGTFGGAVSLGFCPNLLLGKPLCRRNALDWRADTRPGGRVVLPVADHPLPWVVLQGEDDQVCSLDAAQAFVARVSGARTVPLADVGHGFSVARRWLPQLRGAVSQFAEHGSVTSAAPRNLRDLPLIEVTSHDSSASTVAVVLSGDGGWASLDRQVAGVLADSGVSVIGWNSLAYFWRPRTPEQLAADLMRVLAVYAPSGSVARVILAGYSRGASVLPFAANLLTPAIRNRIALVALIAPESSTSFEIHARDLISNTHRPSDRDTTPEINRLGWTRVVCFYGSEERDSACGGVDPAHGIAVAMQGGHHLGGRYLDIGVRILRETQRLAGGVSTIPSSLTRALT